MAITNMNETEQANIDAWMSEAMWGVAMETDADVAANIRALAVEAGLSQ